ncbi:MAG: TIR domain-containing protein [Silvibacterium sp.]
MLYCTVRASITHCKILRLNRGEVLEYTQFLRLSEEDGTGADYPEFTFSFLRICFSAFGRPALRSIFINYRRTDSEGEAGRLFDDLMLRFNPESIFMDVAAIEPGRDFRKAIDKSVATCSVLLAVIGQEWLDSRDSGGGRRLDDPNDFVRIELASALRRDIPVVPVLVRGAKMPHVEQLPDDLKELAYRNAVELSHARWRSDVQVLLQALQPYLDPQRGDAPAAHGVDRQKEPGVPGGQVFEEQAAGRRPDAETIASNIEPKTIERVSKELAAYIGPISEVVVKRAAKRCSSVEDLYGMVAKEIKTETDRVKFLRSCRS